MYKIQTKILNFKYGSIIQTEPVLVTWFKINEFNQGTCFSKDELFHFSRSLRSRPNNFIDPLYFDCFELSADFSFNRVILDPSIHLPKLLILTRNPKEYKLGEVFECMEIVLLNEDKLDYHDCYPNFNILGHVEY